MKKKADEYSDAELFELLSSKKKQLSDWAFAELYQRLSPRIFAYCRRFIGNQEEAQDVFQETFIRFYQSAQQNREMTNVQAFVLRIARNLCVNHVKREKPTVALEDYMVVRAESKQDQDEMLDLVKRALDLLNEDYREMFILREYEGMSYTDIAKVTDLPLSTVKIRIYRAKQKIREILKPYLEEMKND